MKLLLLAILSLILAVSCTKKSTNSSSDAASETTGSVSNGLSSAAKLSSTDCVDPALSDFKQGVQIMLCDGTIAEGTLALRGSWDAETAFPGSGFYTEIENAPTADKLCDDVNFNGGAGSADCSGYEGAVGSFRMHLSPPFHLEC